MHTAKLLGFAFPFLLVCWVFLYAPTALAQRDLSTILGEVTDASGGVLANALVTLTEDATGLQYTVKTDAAGIYLRPLLKPGTYTVAVEASGFKKQVQHNVVLTSGDRVQVNLRLEVGEVTQSVEVSAAPPTLQTQSTIIGQDITEREVADLPLGGQRIYANLALNAAGVVPGESGDRTSGFSASGETAMGQNNFLLNGVDNNVNVIDFFNGAAYVLAPPVDAVGEVKVMVNGYNAEYGRGAGGVIDVNIKSGTNHFHGSLYEYLQNADLDANKWASNRTGVARAPFEQNQFGGSIGGPIFKDKTFFFFDYQGTRVSSTGGALSGLGGATTLSVPFTAFKNGDFTQELGSKLTQIGTDALGNPVYQGEIFDPTTTQIVKGQYVRNPFEPMNLIPQSIWDAAAAKLMALFPNPNQNLTARLPSSNYYTLTTGTQAIHQFDLRLDHRVSEKDTIFGNLSWSTSNKFITPPINNPLDGGGQSDGTFHILGRNAMASWARTWTPTILSETRLGYTRLITDQLQVDFGQNLQQKYGIGGYQAAGSGNGLPVIALSEGNFATGQYLPTTEYSLVYDLIENVTVIRNKHSLKFGWEGRQIKFPFSQFQAPRGQMNFDANMTNQPGFASTGEAYASWLLGYPASGTINTNNFISSLRYAIASYVQDDWKVTSKLTLNLGIRYELFSPVGEQFGRQSMLNIDTLTLQIPQGPNQNTPLPPGFASSYPAVQIQRGVVSKYLVPWDKKDIGPRFGLAYQANSKTVVRMGYGIYYGGEQNQGGSPNLGLSPPFNAAITLLPPNTASFVPTLGRFSDGLPTNIFSLNVPFALTFHTESTNFKAAMVHKWNIALQRELPWHLVAEASYNGAHGQHLIVEWKPNQLLNSPDPTAPTATRYPIPQIQGSIGEVSTFGFSNYDALAAKVEKHLSNGVNFLVSYTLSHALSDAAGGLNGSAGYGNQPPRDVRDYSANYANGSWDVRHRFVYSTVYDLPFGRGKTIGPNWKLPLNAVLANWKLSAILTLQTGPPFTIQTQNQVCGCGGNVLPDLVPGKDPNAPPPGGRTANEWFNITNVMNPAIGTYGDLGLQTNRSPGIRNIDFSLAKAVPIHESIRLQIQGEALNLFNTPRLGTPGNVQGSGSFGIITSATNERHVMVSLRLQF
ncbi:MAG TPA: carboxypeptidase regulatory-like domain-containing protein [Bryobacteraceae bacterium]|nr:carboxypeptidase regulatory-like domain-containing protein [Bryobacteraceae bacterium]